MKMHDGIIKMAHKYLSDLYFTSEGKTWHGNNSDENNIEQIHCDILLLVMDSIFGLSEIQAKYVLNTWLVENGLDMFDLHDYWTDEYKGLKDENGLPYTKRDQVRPNDIAPDGLRDINYYDRLGNAVAPRDYGAWD